MKGSDGMKYADVLEDLFARYPALTVCRNGVYAAAEALCASFRAGGKLLVCGNGGSAADAGHITGELMKSFLLPRPADEATVSALAAYGDAGRELAGKLEGGLPAIALTVHTELMTAVANDTAAETVFAQQVMALGRPGDVLLAISTSGNSRNCVAAAMTAKARGMTVIALTGAGGGKLGGIADVTIAVPDSETFRVQEYHLPVYHALCAAAEKEFFA